MTAALPLSVVTVTYNSEGCIEATLEAIRAHLPGVEIIVVDNGSIDGTTSIVNRTPGTRLMTGHGNVGFGAGANLGIRAAQTTHVLVINPDAPVVEADLEGIREVLGSTRFGIRAAYEFDGANRRPLLLPTYGWRSELVWSLIQWFLVPAEITLRKPSTPWSVPYSSGAAFLIRRDEFLGVGAFNEALFLYHEDEDLSRRYRAANLPVLAERSIVVEHDQGRSSPRDPERIMSWKLLSAVQVAFIAGGEQRSDKAARWVVAGLVAVRTLGRVGARVPLLKGRAAKKRRSADAVLDYLAVEAAVAADASTYPDARASMRRARA